MDALLEAKVRKARDIAAALQQDGGLVAAYVGGSITAGFGNPTSDADLFALTEDLGDRQKVVQFVADGDRIDVEYYTFDEAHKMLDLLATFVPAADNLQALGETKDALDWYSRLLQSTDAVVSPELQRLHERAEEIRPHVQKMAVGFWILFADSMTEDYRGAAASHETNTAVFAAQQMLAYAGKALVAAFGDLYFPAKWVFQQVERTCPDHPAVEGFVDLQAGRWASGTTPDFAAAADATQFLAACATLEVLVPGSTTDLARPTTNTEGPIRHKLGVPVPLKDRALIHFELERQVILPPLVFAVWTLCDGRSTEEILANVQHVISSSGSNRSFDQETLGRILESLKNQGLVSESKD